MDGQTPEVPRDQENQGVELPTNSPGHTVVQGMTSPSQQVRGGIAELSILSAFPCHNQYVVAERRFQLALNAVFMMWIADSAVWAYNLIAAVTYFVVDEWGRITFGLAFLWPLLSTSLSFATYYMYYTSTRINSNNRFLISIVGIVFFMLLNATAALGISNFSVGFVNSLGMLGLNLGAGIVMTISGILFGVMSLMHIVVFVIVVVAKCKRGITYQQDIRH